MSDWRMRWECYDPLEVLIKREELRSKPTRSDRAKQGLENLFTGDDMGRKLEIPNHVTVALFRWGQWSRRPNLWANLRITPFCNLLPIPQQYGRGIDVRLDPQSLAMHKAVMATECTKTQAVLYAYYVANVNWSDQEQRFIRAGISKATFHRLLKVGSLSVYNRSDATVPHPKTFTNSGETILVVLGYDSATV